MLNASERALCTESRTSCVPWFLSQCVQYSLRTGLRSVLRRSWGATEKYNTVTLGPRFMAQKKWGASKHAALSYKYSAGHICLCVLLLSLHAPLMLPIRYQETLLSKDAPPLCQSRHTSWKTLEVSVSQFLTPFSSLNSEEPQPGTWTASGPGQ